MSIKVLRRVVGVCLDYLAMLSVCFANTKPTLKKVDADEIRKVLDVNEKVAIFIHFSTEKIFDCFDRETVNQLERSGFAVVIISTSSIENETKYNRRVFEASNFGRDLAVYRDVAKIAKDCRLNSEILFLNNSIVWKKDMGFDSSISQFIEKNAFSDVIFCTDSMQGGYHAQSYLIYFRNRKQALSIFSDVQNFPFKRAIVYKGERRFMERACRSGFKVSILFPISKLAVELDINPWSLRFNNPTNDFWLDLWNFGFKGVKRKVLASKHENTKNTARELLNY